MREVVVVIKKLVVINIVLSVCCVGIFIFLFFELRVGVSNSKGVDE